MSLLLSLDSRHVDREELARVETPAPEKTWHPIAHHILLDQVATTLERNGLPIVEERLGLSSNSARFFGLLEIGNGNGDTKDHGLVVGVRNSHDKSFAAGIACGSRVVVCDNLSFSGEVQISRLHTRWIERDLPSLIDRAVGRLGSLRASQEARFAQYRGCGISDSQAHDIVINAFDARIIGCMKIPRVLEQWREPEHPEFKERNAWSLFNAFTQTLKDVNAHEINRRTQALHGLFDQHTGHLIEVECKPA